MTLKILISLLSVVTIDHRQKVNRMCMHFPIRSQTLRIKKIRKLKISQLIFLIHKVWDRILKLGTCVIVMSVKLQKVHFESFISDLALIFYVYSLCESSPFCSRLQCCAARNPADVLFSCSGTNILTFFVILVTNSLY